MTCIVGIRTPKIVVIAADSMGTFKGYDPETVRPVCKIFRVREAGFAIAGLTKDPVRGFDLERIVAEALWYRSSISNAIRVLC
jgi:20S proteasome alpha/beta subunit